MAERIELPEARDARVDRRVHGRLVGHVADARLAVDAERRGVLRGLLDRLGLHVEAEHAPALARDPLPVARPMPDAAP